ncbi:MAG: DUF4340 domain-containing protein [Clostridia bacterium]|nr:DUF4340 domain-containing protein [Clostridia bacterium]
MSKNQQIKTTDAKATVKSGSSVATKTIVTFVILGVVLLSLIGSLVLIVILTSRDDEDEPAFDVWEGEDVFGNAAHLAYPLIENQDVLRIDIQNETGSYSFTPVWDEGNAKYVWRIDGHKNISINATSFEMLRMYLCTVTTKDPIREVPDEELADYGVDSSCKTKYTLHFKEKGEEKSYTVRIGNKTNSSDNTYYAYIEGRNHVYKLASDLQSYSTMSMLQYLSPSINTFFVDSTAALLGIDSFEIYSSKDSLLSSIITIRVKEKEGTEVSFEAVYPKNEAGKVMTTVASTSYINDVFTLLYTAFSGDEVVAISPTAEDLAKFGLSDGDRKYLINAKFAENAAFASPAYKQKEPALYVSQEIDGYYYVLSKYFSDDLIVKVKGDNMPFLKEDSYSLIKWTDKASITSGFYETLCKNAKEDAPGLNKIIIKSLKNEDTGEHNEETFILTYNETDEILSVKAQNSGLSFVDNPNAEISYDKNWFRNLYVYFLYYPFIDDFNTMTSEEMAVYEKDDNIVYSITAFRNDGVVVRYTYYKIDVNFAFEKAESGNLNEDGSVTWKEPIYDYTASMTQLRKVYLAIDKLLSGERVTPDDQLL